jgi:hypothetical protein
MMSLTLFDPRTKTVDGTYVKWLLDFGDQLDVSIDETAKTIGVGVGLGKNSVGTIEIGSELGKITVVVGLI